MHCLNDRETCFNLQLDKIILIFCDSLFLKSGEFIEWTCLLPLIHSVQIVEIPGKGGLLDAVEDLTFLPGLNLEGFPNRDSTAYVKEYGIESARTIIRGTIRYKVSMSLFIFTVIILVFLLIFLDISQQVKVSCACCAQLHIVQHLGIKSSSRHLKLANWWENNKEKTKR